MLHARHGTHAAANAHMQVAATQRKTETARKGQARGSMDAHRLLQRHADVALGVDVGPKAGPPNMVFYVGRIQKMKTTADSGQGRGTVLYRPVDVADPPANLRIRCSYYKRVTSPLGASPPGARVYKYGARNGTERDTAYYGIHNFLALVELAYDQLSDTYTLSKEQLTLLEGRLRDMTPVHGGRAGAVRAPTTVLAQQEQAQRRQEREGGDRNYVDTLYRPYNTNGRARGAARQRAAPAGATPQ